MKQINNYTIMTQEHKDLLLKDLCSRLPYNIKCTYYDKCVDEEDEGTITGMQNGTYFVIDGGCIDVENVKPYLIPMSSMSAEQIDELKDLCDMYNPVNDYDDYEDWGTRLITKHFMDDEYQFKFNVPLFEFLNKNRLDYCGLIKKGLAIDATGLDIY